MTSEPNRPETYFKYVTAQVAKIILASRKLRWSSPLLFDDIFDVKRDFNLGFDIKELKEPLVNEVMNLLSAGNIPDLSSKPLVEWFIKSLRRKDCADEREIILKELPQLTDEGMQLAMNGGYKEIKRVWSELIPQFRILCLSAIHDNLRMWADYSDSHKGVVLELQCIDRLSPWQISRPVIYQDAPPILATKQEWIKSITGEQTLNYDELQFWEPYITTKTRDWEYQKEWRIVSFCDKEETGRFSDYRFDPRELRSVYLGCDISREDATDISSLLKFDLTHVNILCGKKLVREQRLLFEPYKSIESFNRIRFVVPPQIEVSSLS